MMREIKFRALTKPCTLSESMGLKPKIVYGTGIFKDPVNTWLCSHNDAFCMAHDMLKQIVDPETLGQYTGLKDKNGMEIYEGDILDFDEKEFGGKITPEAVEWDNKNGCWDFGSGSVCDIQNFRQVTGNIHENPELLEVTQ